MNRRGLPARVWKERSAYVFLLPGMVIFSVFTLAALVFAVYLTFHRWSIIEPDKPFVGLDNYRDMMHDERFVESVLNTVYFSGASVPLSMVTGLLLALLVNLPLRMRGLFRAAFYLPVVTPFVVSAILWKWLYNSDYGLFNYYLLQAHLIDDPLLWLSDKNIAMPAVILMSVWAGAGFSMVVYLAGLQAIPQELYEAARIDGAGCLAPPAVRHDPHAPAHHPVPARHGHHQLTAGLHPDLRDDQRRTGQQDDDDGLLHVSLGVQVLRHGLRQHAGVRALPHAARLHGVATAPGPARGRRMTGQFGLRQKALTYLVLAPLAILFLAPFAWLVSASFQPMGRSSPARRTGSRRTRRWRGTRAF